MEQTSEQISFPTQPDDQGFFFETESDKENNVLTRSYENGGKVKIIKLSTGDEVQVRRLKGSANAEIKRFMGDDAEKYLTAGITVASTVNGAKQTFEYFDDLWLNDYNQLTSVYKDLNF